MFEKPTVNVKAFCIKMTMKIIMIYGTILLVMTKIECELFYQIGLYSNCTGKANRTQFNIDVGLVSDFNRDIVHMMKSYQQEFYSTNYIQEFETEVYDVCDNVTHLAEILQNLTLNARYKIQVGNRNY